MKNKLEYSILTIFIIVFGLSACNKDFLNTQPLNAISSDATWADPGLAQAFVTDIYNGLQNGGFFEQQLSSLSDEAVFTHPGRGINTVNEGTLTPSNLGSVDGTYDWGQMYNRVRAANLSLENLKMATFTDTALIKRLMGEAHFLRAYYYHQLVRYYGAVPIITQTYGLDEDYTVARNTFEECVNFIVSDCDSSIMLLSGRTMDKGRASAIAAMALKSRVLLYAASDLHDIPTAKAKSSTIAGYSNPELLGYVSGDRTARWQAAKDAANAVLQAGSGYKLNFCTCFS